MELSQKFCDKMHTLMGDEEYQQYIKTYDEPSVDGIRLNTLKINKDEFKALSGYEVKNVKWCKEGFYCEEKTGKSVFHHSGLYYIQEPSAMSAASVLPVKAGDRVLDMCSAPGGKATQLAARMENEGILFANDISSGRVKAVVKNIELFGLKNVIVMSEDPKDIEDRFANYFDAILIDAPCSGEGMFRRKPDLIKTYDDKMVDFCEKTQRQIIKSGAKMLKPNGYMVYSTCTFSPEEDEMVIEEFLAENEDFELCEISSDFGFEKGRPQWTKSKDEKFLKCARVWPHKMQGEGHFISLLHKKEIFENEPKIVFEKPDKDKKIQIFEDFVSKELNIKADFFDGIYKLINDNLYLLSNETPSLKGLRILRSGLLLGEFKKDRFEPSQSLAMYLKKENAKITADMDINDERVIRYLKGETVDFDGIKDGWCLVCASGYPLGWAKSQKGRLKNKYRTGWRWE